MRSASSGKVPVRWARAQPGNAKRVIRHVQLDSVPSKTVRGIVATCSIATGVEYDESVVDVNTMLSLDI